MVLLNIPLSSASAPVILTHINNASSNLYPHQQVNTDVAFVAAANQSIVTWTWIVDGTDVGNNNPSYTKSWTGPGNHNVTVYGTNPNGTTNHISWYPIIERKRSTAGQVVATISNTGYDNFTDAIYTGDYEGVIGTMPEPFTAKIGDYFYLIFFGIIFIVIGIKQDSVLIPAGLGIIFGSLFMSYLPQSFVKPVQLMIVLIFVGILYRLYKERG